MHVTQLLKIVITASLVYTSIAYTEEETFKITIAPASRHDALIEFASQVGYDILFGPDTEAKKTINGFSGEYSINAALNTILNGSDLNYQQIDKQIRITTNQKKSVRLPVVTVQGYLRNANLHISRDDSSLNQFPLNQVPLSIQSISREHIEDVQSRSVEDLLSYISGVDYFASNGGISSQYYSRGVETPFSIDGKFYRRTTLALDPSVLDRVDLVQGPSANFLSPGGLLNFVTKKPHKNSHREYSIGLGSEDFYRLDFDLNLADKNTQKSAFRIIGLAQKQKHIKKFAFREKFVIAPSLAFEYDNMSQLLLSAYHKSEDLYPNIFTFHSILGADIPRDRTLSAPWAEASIRDSFIAADVSNLDINGWLVNTGANWNYSKTDNTFTTALLPLRPLDPGYTREGDFGFLHLTSDFGHLKAYGEDVNQAYSLDLAAEKSFSLLGLPTLFRIGADYLNHTRYAPIYEPIRIIGIFNIYQPDYAALVEPPPPVEIGFFKQSNHFYGLFISQSFYLPKDITLHSGFRYENIRVDDLRKINLPNEQTGTTIFRANARYKELTPQLGINIAFTDTFSSHISYLESFSFQNSSRTTQMSDAEGSRSIYLSPIKNRQFEFVLKKEWLEGKLLSDLSFYNMQRSNLLKSGQSEDPSDDDQSSKGAILSISGAATTSLELLANISYNKNTTIPLISAAEGRTIGASPPTEFNAGNRALGTAKILANVWFNYTQQTGPLKNYSFGIGIKHVGERYGSNDNDFTLPAYTKYDGFISYNGWKNLSLAFSVQNFTDKYYYKSSLGIPQLVEEGDPRGYFLTIKSKMQF